MDAAVNGSAAPNAAPPAAAPEGAQPKVDAAPAPKDQAATKRTLKFKSAGGERELNLDDEKHLAELVELAQKGDGYTQKSQRLAEERKQFAAQQQQLAAVQKAIKEGDLDEILRLRGMTPEQYAAEVYERVARAQKLTPEQREFEEQKRQFEAQRRELEEQRKEQQQARERVEFESAQRQVAQEMATTLEKFKGKLVPTQATARELAIIYHREHRQGDTEFTWDDAAEVLIEEQSKRDGLRLNALSGEDFIQRYPELAARVQQALIARATKTDVPTAKTVGKTNAPRRTPEQQDKPKSMQDWERKHGIVLP